MASLRPRPLSLGFMLFVLCLHHCSARKVFMDDLKLEAAHVHDKSKSPSTESDDLDPGIGLECGTLGCQTGGIPCLQEPCSPGYEIIPQPPHIVYPQPIIEPTPPQVVPLPPTPPCTTPCEPWYGPGPCPCEPCEEGAADKEGVKTDQANDKAQEGKNQVSSISPGKEKQDGAKQVNEPMKPMSSSELTWKMAKAPTPASYSNNGGSELRV